MKPLRTALALALALAVAVSAVAPVAVAQGAPITETQASLSSGVLTDSIATGPTGAVYASVRLDGATYSIANMSTKPPVVTQCAYNGQTCAVGGMAASLGSLWFVSTVPINGQAADQHAPPSLGKLTTTPTGPAVGLVQFLPSFTDLPYAVAADASGALWVCDGQGVIDRYVPGTTVVQQFPVPVSSAGPLSIAKGPDNAMWFTQTAGNTIGRIATTGTIGAITNYGIPTVRAGLYGITTGPDGAVWFTESRTGRIGRITTSGHVTEFQIPIKNASPRGIVSTGGALWFTDPGTNAVGRMTTAGAVTEYALKTARSVPNAITLGGDGAIWFTESANKATVGRLTPSSPPTATRRVRATRVVHTTKAATKHHAKKPAKKKKKSKSSKKKTKKKPAKKRSRR